MYVICLICFRKKISAGIVFVQVAARFIEEKPIIFLTPIVKILMTFYFGINNRQRSQPYLKSYLNSNTTQLKY